MDSSIRIGFIGAGNMAQAIGISLLEKGLVKPDQICVSAPSSRNFKPWVNFGVVTTNDNHDVILKSDVIFLAMKPQYVDMALANIHIAANEWTFSKLVVSMVAGLSTEALHAKLKPILLDYRIVLIMPNTSLLVGEGFTPICPDESASPDDIELVKTIMSAGGICEVVPEPLMASFGAVSGCGVAFVMTSLVYSIMEALSDGAVKQGVPRAQSYRAVAQTLLGAAKMVLETGEHPAVLKDKVTSPGGVTICGIHELEKGGLRATLMNALEACVNKFAELDRKTKK